ncbi:MAG: hydrogenase nickel incorporation protein HypB [Thermodesulfovibrio sp.]|uniref:hydrogenase nickel incorporation protein HypB n=1 Tax=unclassified Thermodesulfovibrio TaxID=2645936 RepID=UPI000839E7CC|nr:MULTISPECIES: hydrogenase nickel incorporation protein HypB [unclassified Thermodesulfovibrio]MDI1472527.1 hydrogenase nickel incorporation protein HypB [Thermodesulfovibrio sp. 1176]MDI6714436.1 hydrogenase nickel incorporation protein HypB [Thermodesulfovibrio sp.]ODA44862.1 [NiFe] hydrogenase nickel incorporation-associated protein HypB [Thermodesulfovibrio sp. N1]
MKVMLTTKILDANERIAEENKKMFKESGVYVVNLMSSPGAGKTSLLEKTIEAIKDKVRVGVIEGDITGTNDAERIDRLGVPVIQINTEGACHLDANMIANAAKELPLKDLDLLFIENVGNLVCPAEFKVGEDVKVMILSLTEGDDKPLKYPLMFQESSVLIINKIDLKDYLDVSIDKIKKDAQFLNPKIKIFEVSCKTGQGIDEWTNWLLTSIS